MGENIKNTLIDIVQKDSFGVAVYFDGWKNAKKQEILGSVLVTSEGQVLVWGGEDLQENVWYQNGGMYFLAPTLLIKVSNKFNCRRDFKEFLNLVIATEKAIHQDEEIHYSDKESETSNDKNLPLDICKIIDSEVRWKEIRQLEKLLLPFYEALNKLQAENARLHDVLHSFGYFYKIWLTKIWGENDFIFGKTVIIFSLKVINHFSFVQLSQWMIYYYCACLNGCLPNLQSYRKQDFPFNNISLIQFRRVEKGFLHTDKKFKTTIIAIPVIQEQQEDGLFQVSNDNDDQDPERDIESSCEWRNLINEWIEMVDEDEQINQTYEENSENLEPLIECVMDLDQILRKQHPLITKMLNGS
ncbi:unnamed protein product [Rhizophagus irregularis]|nr:unnamed protein product [Rhizophagus irregularis]